MPEQDFYFNPFDAEFRANPYPHFRRCSRRAAPAEPVHADDAHRAL